MTPRVRRGVLLRLPPELLQRVDEARGVLNRTVFLVTAIEGYLNSLEVPDTDEEHGEPIELQWERSHELGIPPHSPTGIPPDGGPAEQGSPFPVGPGSAAGEGSDPAANFSTSPPEQGVDPVAAANAEPANGSDTAGVRDFTSGHGSAPIYGDTLRQPV